MEYSSKAIKETGKHYRRIEKMRSEINTPVAHLKATYAKTSEPVPFCDKDKLEYKPIAPLTRWGKVDRYDCAWFHFVGTVPMSAKGKHVYLHIDIGGEGLGYNGDEPSCMTTSVEQFVDRLMPARGKTLMELAKSAEGGEKVDMFIDAGCNTFYKAKRYDGVYTKGDIVVFNDELKEFYYNYVAVAYLLPLLEKGSDKYKQIDAALDRAYAKLGKRSSDEIATANNELMPFLHGTPDPMKITAVGHAHLDLAWLWPIRETKRKTGRTFTKQLENTENFNGYIYGASQPQQYAWLQKYYPATYEKVKQAVLEGRIEPQGGMWVEADTNVSSGEALIRQMYYGKKFFRDEFGQDMRICWLPDVFGYNANLPQILKKSGIPYFMTIKLSWNEHNKFPHRTFNWEGIDDSEILVHMPPDETYNSQCTPICLAHTRDNLPETEKGVVDEALFVFGVGDGGGGPSESHIELLRRGKSLEGIPSADFGTAIGFFDRLNEKRSKLQSYKGELYLEKHQGTYTTQARNKNFNRRLEYELCDLEALYAFAELTRRGLTVIDKNEAKDFVYPQAKLDEIWKEVLLYQFHDIIPGSSIQRVYDESRARYAEILSGVREEKNKVLQMFAKGEGVSAFNPTSFSRREYVRNGDKWYLVEAAPYASAKVEKVKSVEGLSFGRNYIQNDKLKVTFNDKGQITSVFDKQNSFEYAKGLMNELRVYKDERLHYNAWDIEWKYYQKPFEVLSASGIKMGIDGAEVYAEMTYVHGKSTIKQRLFLRKDGDTVEFNTKVDWHETHRMLRAEFEPSVYADKVKCDIQMGSFMRSTHEDNSIEEAQFEICAHKYIDLSNGGKGISLINNNKYGYRVKKGRISMNLLRSPVYPDKTADRGEQAFNYALYPHIGDAGADTISRAYFFNKDCLFTDGTLPALSLASTDNENVVVETIKLSGDGKGVIVRVYNDSNDVQTANVKTAFALKSVFETNLIEENETESSLENVSFKPFEIRTFKLA